MKLTQYALDLIDRIDRRTPEEKRRAYRREWQRKKRAAIGVAAVWKEDQRRGQNGG